MDSSTSQAELLRGLGLSFVLGQLLGLPSKKEPNSRVSSRSWLMHGAAIKTAGFFLLFLASKSWLTLVDQHVPEPYLDEVFHIPQAQTYCAGRFWEWNDKITTPPGLYLLSVADHKLRMLTKCTPFSLRSNNLLATLLIALVASQCRHFIEIRAAEREGKQVPGNVSFYSYHTGINVALVPVIFFFSALYYTDVVSTFVVLVAYRNHLLRLGPQPPNFLNGIWTVILGVAALFMRQTNVFWVVVYMGGLEVVHVLRSVKSRAQARLIPLHDPPLNKAGPEDWMFCVLSIAVTALCNPLRVLRQIWPHLTILALFGGFVAWNGGVVLGDKSNHIATIHLPQMLYIWPLFAFFSAPLFLPSIFAAITRPAQYFRSLLSLTSKRAALVSISYTLLTILVSLAVVKYNTIIHPFTLADNRHYMFYVFRYTILRSPTIRLSLVAAYILTRWLVWDQLAGSSHDTMLPKDTTTTPPLPPKQNNPRGKHATAPVQAKVTAPGQEKIPTPTQQTTPSRSLTLLTNPTSRAASTTPPPTSTALLWLLTTTLSLITAPLVEPRYFILPWVFYRLLLPAWSVTPFRGEGTGTGTGGSKGKDGALAWLWKVGERIDVRLVLETMWFVVVNAGTMYMFLFRPFYWRGADGEVLDGGRVQRFMW